MESARAALQRRRHPTYRTPAGFVIDWSERTVSLRRDQLNRFEQRWKELAPRPQTDVPQRVDYRLLGSALARVRWELDIEQSWRRNPEFYVDQTLGAVYVLLLPPAPFEPIRQTEIIHRLQSIPVTIGAAKANLTDMRKPFAQLAIAALDNLPERMRTMQAALAPNLLPENREALSPAAADAVSSLQQYRQWLQDRLPSMRPDTAIGRENYLFFLHNVALLPYSPEQLLEMSGGSGAAPSPSKPTNTPATWMYRR